MVARRVVSITSAVLLALTISACSESGGDLEAFCEQAFELDESQSAPTDEQLDRLVDLAPSEIKDETEILVASAREFRSGSENAADSDSPSRGRTVRRLRGRELRP